MTGLAKGDVEAEQRLVDRCLLSDSIAFAVLTERYYKPISSFLYRRLGRGDMVEDLAQETFLEAWKSLRQGRKPEQFSNWLFTIARNRVGKYLRRKRPMIFDPTAVPIELSATSDRDTLDQQERETDLLAQLEKELAHLPADMQRLLKKKHQQGKTFQQMALEEGRPVGTLKSLLARAYQGLRLALQAKGDPQ